MTDEDLFRRFAALKSSTSSSASGSTTQNTYIHRIAAAEKAAKRDQDDLERIADGRPIDPDSTWGGMRQDQGDRIKERRALEGRYRDIKGKDKAWNIDDLGLGDDDDGDDDVEAFLASLSAAQPDIGSSKRSKSDIKLYNADLAKEADVLLRQSRNVIEPLASDQDLASEDITDGAGGDDTEADHETEQEILERALAEAEMEAEAEQKERKLAASTGTTVLPQEPASTDSDNETDSDFAFPSIPNHQPLSEGEPDDQNDVDIDSRMSLLLGLSGPSAKPGEPKLPTVPSSKPVPGRQAGQGWNLPGWEDGRDEDLDSWCCICNKDATVQCAGCDDDVYCDECWRDGHGVGGEQGHRARRFAWGKRVKVVQGS